MTGTTTAVSWASTGFRILLLGVAAMLPASFVHAQAPAPALRPITLSLDFIMLGRFAPWYVAVAKNYYRDAGLDVKIVPSQGTAQAVQALEAGIAQFAVSDLAGLVVARAQGTSTAKMIAVVYQKSPYAIYTLSSGANVTKPEQLQGLEIASGAGSATPKIIIGFMRDKGLDVSKVRFTNIDGSARVGMLLADKVPAIETFILAKPGIERTAGPDKVTTFLLADHGLDLYSSGLLATDAFLAANPGVAKAFVKASMMGWRDAMANPQEAAKLMTDQVKALQPEAVLSELQIVRDLAVTPDVRAKGFGTIDRNRFAAGIDFLVRNVDLAGNKPAADTMLSLDYLPQPPVMAGN
jgi:NitT/TauT family transport system substrate-binding protein